MNLLVSREDVVAFRLRMHHLSERLGEGNLAEATGRCGVQDSPPGSALLSLHARVQGVSPAGVETAIGEDKTLLRTWCMRGSPHLIPTSEASVFTTGVLPVEEQGERHLIGGVGWALDRLGMSLTEAVQLIEAGVREVLPGRRLAITDLGEEVARQVTPALPAHLRIRWEEEGPYAQGQPLGEAVVHFCLRILALRQVVCFAPRTGNKAPFVLMEEWLDTPAPPLDPGQARAELLRRYLRSYGPSTRAHFAAWLGVRVRDVGPWWEELAGELVPVDDNGAAWLLEEDAAKLGEVAAATGIRLLPPGDPYTQLRDRWSILDERLHREVWRSAGSPGTVLLDGEIVGTWRHRSTRGRMYLHLNIWTPEELSGVQREALDTEAQLIASLRGAARVTVGFGRHGRPG